MGKYYYRNHFHHCMIFTMIIFTFIILNFLVIIILSSPIIIIIYIIFAIITIIIIITTMFHLIGYIIKKMNSFLSLNHVHVFIHHQLILPYNHYPDVLQNNQFIMIFLIQVVLIVSQLFVMQLILITLHFHVKDMFIQICLLL